MDKLVEQLKKNCEVMEQRIKNGEPLSMVERMIPYVELENVLNLKIQQQILKATKNGKLD